MTGLPSFVPLSGTTEDSDGALPACPAYRQAGGRQVQLGILTSDVYSCLVVACDPQGGGDRSYQSKEHKAACEKMMDEIVQWVSDHDSWDAWPRPFYVDPPKIDYDVLIRDDHIMLREHNHLFSKNKKPFKLVNGYHRFAAAKRIGLTHIYAEVIQHI